MSFLNSITNYFDSSAEHANRAWTYLSEAGSSVYEGGSSVVNGSSNLFSTTAAVAATTAFYSFEGISGRIIGANSATHFANWGASLLGGTQATSWAAQATTCAAMALVQYPVGSMALLMAGSIIATHPYESLEAVKEFGGAVYSFVEAGVELTAAVGEAAFALGLKGTELADVLLDSLVSEVSLPSYVEMTNLSGCSNNAVVQDAWDVLLGGSSFIAI